MISPNLLRSGDTIAIVSTARKVLKKELAPAILFIYYVKIIVL